MVTAIVLAVIGVAMFLGGYQMDRLEFRKIHPASIPGLVPMGLGLLLSLCAVLMFRSARASADEELISTGKGGVLIWTALLCLIYALVLVGWLPFLAATFLFITLFVALFSWPAGPELKPRLKSLAVAVLFGAVMSVAISALFRYGFLVRLP